MKIRSLNCLATVLLSTLILPLGCSKDDDQPAVGRSSAVFNPSVTYGTIKDQDGNTYKTVTIGTQTWMAENLRTKKYRNGDVIDEATNSTLWKSASEGVFCAYNYTQNKDSVATFGLFYNRQTINDSRNIAPEGWHVSTDVDWTQLMGYLQSPRGLKLRETGTLHWNSSAYIATNETGFTALPGGICSPDGIFTGLGMTAYFMTSDPGNGLQNNYWILRYDLSDLGIVLFPGTAGAFVRCVKD